MNDSARSSMANVTSPPAPEPACSLPAWPPSSGATSSRSAVASSRARRRGESLALANATASSAGRALVQGHVDGLLLPVADDSNIDRVPWIVARDQPRKVRLLDDLLAVDRGDVDSAYIDLLSLEPDLLIGAMNPVLISGTRTLDAR